MIYCSINYHYILVWYFPCVANIHLYIWQALYSLSVQCRNKLNYIVETAGKIMGCTPERLETLYKKQVLSKARKIRENEQHFLASKYEMLPSERRLKTVFVKTDRFRYSFIPSSIRLMNSPQIWLFFMLCINSWLNFLSLFTCIHAMEPVKCSNQNFL